MNQFVCVLQRRRPTPVAINSIWRCREGFLVFSNSPYDDDRQRRIQCLSTTSFFSYTSGRARRRRDRIFQQQQNQKNRNNNNSNPQLKISEEEDRRRVIKDILFPNPYENHSHYAEHRFKWPRSLSVWRQAVTMAWRDYRATWEGFFSDRGLVRHDDETSQTQEKNVDGEDHDKTLQEKSAKVQANLQRNVQFIKEETVVLQKQVQDTTGINNTDDLKKVAGDMMRLASDCVKEFLSGYRQGRDDEVEKMLTQYFRELETGSESDNAIKKRRRPKRRITVHNY